MKNWWSAIGLLCLLVCCGCMVAISRDQAARQAEHEARRAAQVREAEHQLETARQSVAVSERQLLAMFTYKVVTGKAIPTGTTPQQIEAVASRATPAQQAEARKLYDQALGSDSTPSPTPTPAK